MSLCVLSKHRQPPGITVYAPLLPKMCGRMWEDKIACNDYARRESGWTTWNAQDYLQQRSTLLEMAKLALSENERTFPPGSWTAALTSAIEITQREIF